ncbi:LOW QUALITY PROTEIN: uncharacterized protein LOC125528403 [Triticum urartu]|nr:LOW QUALITY PROTEIN: uncharacterized protein LOC125528403 [Triticum urartu]
MAAQPVVGPLMMSDPESATTKSSTTQEEDVLPKNLVATLPAREGWSEPLVQYHNYWFRPGHLERILLVKQAFVPRADDIILATQPKCGTTWLKALAFTITNRSRYGFIDHPLLTHHPQHLVPFIQIPCAGTGHTNIDPFGFPRLLATHTPMSLLPPGMRSLGCRVVYLCRDPKDALVSRLHFENKAFPGTDLSMDRCFSMFCKGFSPYGPFWDHCLEYWRESMARPDSVLFLKYEEIKSDPTQVVRKLAKFLGVPLTEEEERSGVAQEVVRLCSFEALTSLQVNQVGRVHFSDNIVMSNSVFYRKGEVGDWVNHMSQEMGEELDCIVQHKLEGSGLVFAPPLQMPESEPKPPTGTTLATQMTKTTATVTTTDMEPGKLVYMSVCVSQKIYGRFSLIVIADNIYYSYPYKNITRGYVLGGNGALELHEAIKHLVHARSPVGVSCGQEKAIPWHLERILLVKQSFVPRADDIILAMQPKCGTTWIKALAFTITNRSRYGFSNHPLLTHHPQHLMPFIQIPGAVMSHTDIHHLASPRLLATHTPILLLSPGMRSLGCRVVYLCRDPKDALVSRLHFKNKAFPGTDLSMDGSFSMFCEGFSPYGPFWDHCLEYWRESVARPDSVLFLKYEEIMSDLEQVPPTEEEESSGVAQEVVRLCSFETLTSLQVNQVGGVRHGDSASIGSSAYYRKGEVGDWANHMSHEMADKLDRIVQQKLDGSGLVF